MKKLMLGLMMAFAVTAEAEKLDVEIDGLKYTLDTMRKDATITGYTGSPTKVEVGEVEWEGQKYAVTSVGNGAFYASRSLTSVSLPNVTMVEDDAFGICECLASVSLPNATTIGDAAFGSCIQLTEVSLPSATTIGGHAFDSCRALASVALPKVTTIGNYAFFRCPLTDVSLPSATMIGENAFNGCSKLTSVSLPKVIGIGKDAFIQCDTLSTLCVNGLMKSVIETNGRGTLGLSGGVAITDSGAQGDYKFVSEDSVVVTKESIQAAKAETVQIVNGQVALGVSVLSNADITVSTANWAPVKFTKDTQIGLSEDGTKLILPIPVAAQQGFMILQSGDVKAVPSDGGTSGFYMIKVVQ